MTSANNNHCNRFETHLLTMHRPSHFSIDAHFFEHFFLPTFMTSPTFKITEWFFYLAATTRRNFRITAKCSILMVMTLIRFNSMFRINIWISWTILMMEFHISHHKPKSFIIITPVGAMSLMWQRGWSVRVSLLLRWDLKWTSWWHRNERNMTSATNKIAFWWFPWQALSRKITAATAR